jgi:hypothetical protein
MASRVFKLPVKTLLGVFLLLCLSARARLEPDSDIDVLLPQSDLIVIARPVSVKETDEKTSVFWPWPQIPVVGVETTFEVLSVLKGSGALKQFVFHHFRRIEKPHRELDSPQLVSFDPNTNESFLLFLKVESEGRYASAAGQVDPAAGIHHLEHLKAPLSRGAIGALEHAIMVKKAINQRDWQTVKSSLLKKTDVIPRLRRDAAAEKLKFGVGKCRTPDFDPDHHLLTYRFEYHGKDNNELWLQYTVSEDQFAFSGIGVSKF